MYLKSLAEMKKSSVLFMLHPAKSVYVFIITLCIFIMGFLFWASFAPLDDVIKSTVILRPTSTISSVKCITNGQLYSKNFKNDDLVEKGEPLFSLDTTVFESELQVYNQELDKVLNEQLINETLLQTIMTEKIQSSEDFSDIYVLAKSYLTELKRYETTILEAKLKLNREKEKPDSLRVPQNITDLENQLYQNELLFETWKNNQKIICLDSQKSLQSTKNSIESHITEIERLIKNATIYAPISGRVSEVTELNVGDYLLAGVEILRIIPQDDKKLKAEIYIDPSLIARVKKGNPVKIKFPGLPPSSYGIIETEISLVPPDISYINGTSVFIAEALINSSFLITKKGKSAQLLPGMTAECRIVTDTSTLLQMFLRKLDFIN